MCTTFSLSTAPFFSLRQFKLLPKSRREKEKKTKETFFRNTLHIVSYYLNTKFSCTCLVTECGSTKLIRSVFAIETIFFVHSSKRNRILTGKRHPIGNRFFLLEGDFFPSPTIGRERILSCRQSKRSEPKQKLKATFFESYDRHKLSVVRFMHV